MGRLEAMTAFVAVCDAKGFTAGGRRLGLSPSAISRLIGGLEEHLGARLLQRTTRTLSLTDIGQRYLERAKQILAEVEEAEAGLQADQTIPRGRLVVAAPRMFGRLHVAPHLNMFMQRFHGISVELQLNDRNVNLVEEGVDVAIRIGELEGSNLVARRLGSTRRVVVASPGYLRRRSIPVRPRDLAGHDVVAFMPLDTAPHWTFANAERDEADLLLTPRLLTNSAETALDAAVSGGGITRLLAYQAAALIRAGQLRVLLSEFEPPPAPISAVYPSSRLLSSKVRAFIDLLVERADWHFVDLA
ncbi:MAG: LysR family transcriptional regulator [Alphaproteobacteria bacterium]|nr:LysR family transcriptional regulator [Alphaproteobacteria bacterium]